MQRPETTINGSVLDQSEPTGEQSTDQVNQRADEMARASMAFANTLNKLVVNFHNAYDSNVNALRQVTDAMQMRIEGASARNRELTDVRYTMNEELESLRDEVTNLRATVHDLNGRVQTGEARDVENATKYRRLNDNIITLLNYSARMLEIVDRIQNEPASKRALSQMLNMLTARLDGTKRVTENPSLPAIEIPEVPTLQEQTVEGGNDGQEAAHPPNFGRELEGQRPPSTGRNKMPVSPQGPSPDGTGAASALTSAPDEAPTFAMPASSSTEAAQPLVSPRSTPKAPPANFRAAGASPPGTRGNPLPPPMVSPRSDQQLAQFVENITKSMQFNPIYHVPRGEAVLDRHGTQFDQNYCLRVPADRLVPLTNKVRNTRRLFTGGYANAVTVQHRRGLTTPGGARIHGETGNELNKVFVELYGQHAYGFISLKVLEGPSS